MHLYLLLVILMMINECTKSFKLFTTRRRFSSLSMSMKYTISDRLNYAVSVSAVPVYKGDVLVIPFYSDKNSLKERIPSSLSTEIKTLIEDVIDEGVFKAEPAQKHITRVSSIAGVKYIALVGLGQNPKLESATDIEVSSAARLGRTVAAVIKDIKANTVGVLMPPSIGNAGLTQFFLGLHDGSYNDNRFKKVPEGGHKPPSLSNLTILGCSDSIAADMATTHKLTEMIASGVNFARDLVGAPPNYKTPVTIANLAKEIATTHKLECRVLGEAECKALGMGGYLGVQQGSKFPPQFVHLIYKPEKPSSDVVKVALIGKGLTFDSGGYNLKAGAGSMIELMKFDMGGCAAVLGCAKAIAQLRPRNVEVHFITAICENMISAEAMRPGDILVASNGKTIEVLNTDAEGRLTLADALVYADKLGVDNIIDLATLTGACIVGLGEKLAGLYSPDDKLREAIVDAAKRTDEGIWALPLEASYKELIKSNIADLKNIGSKGGGSITAALFLQEFVDKAKWAHIDMAGPVWDTTSSKPTGYGVKLLIDYLLNVKKG